METSTSASLQTISESEYLSFLIGHAVDNNFSVAVWRYPKEDTRHLIISRQHQLIAHDATLEDLPTGFLFAPYDRSADRIFLKADLSFSFSEGTLKLPVDQTQIASAAWVQTHLSNVKKSPKPGYHKGSYQPPSTGERDFINLVEESIRNIGKGVFEKVVPSRNALLQLPPDLDIVKAFMKLSAENPNALVSFVSTPEGGSWIGATPELLVNVEDRNIFKTIALAGTQPYVEGTDLRSVAWKQKDIEEQALVERYIISCFKKIRVREYDEFGPRTTIAGNLLHLKSEFIVDMQAINFPQLGSVMLELLHPTSAVCGVPLDTSLNFLRTHEGYDRQFYTGYLGPVNFNNDISIFVNLRCAQLLEQNAVLYAGAGVTIDSIPELEWAETEMKMGTLRSALRQE